MKIEFISHNPENSSLILIFAGWSTAPSLYEDVRMTGWDVAVIYDYDNLNLDFSFLDKYSTIWVFAWSLGVRIAAITLPSNKITAAYAINGTLNPVDNEEGIPVAIYNGTAENLDARNLKKFRRRMAPDADTFRRVFDTDFCEDEIVSLKKQLYLIGLLDVPNTELPWRRAYIGTDDKIFPPANMERCWNKIGVEIVKLPNAHYIPLLSIVKSVIPDYDTIAKRFHDAHNTYNDNARAQRMIVNTLAGLLSTLNIPTGAKILEIGPGTGLFTDKYAKVLKPAEVHFVDIAPLRPMNVADKEIYFCEDAEKWMRECVDKYDCILSSSTIQWFANIPEFLYNCSKSLRLGGVVVLSSFLPGNLGELDALRPSPIHYHTETEYREWLEKYFTDIEIHTEKILMEFSSPRELLMHLKHTGVAGSAPSPHVSPAALRSIHTITYHPIYITATRRE